MSYFHTVEHYTAKKRSKLLAHATTWVNLTGIILNEKKFLYDLIYMNFKNRHSEFMFIEPRMIDYILGETQTHGIYGVLEMFFY